MDQDAVDVLDVGGADVNGSYREIFAPPRFRYRNADITLNEHVDIHMSDPNVIPLENSSIDIVLCGQMLEHCPRFWLLFPEMLRILSDKGFLFLIAPSAGPIHRFPVDCYRFYPDSYKALAEDAGCDLVEVFMDKRGPWRDLVGVFTRKGHPGISTAPPPTLPRSMMASRFSSTSPARTGEEEGVSGAKHYLEALSEMHARLSPRLYLEIGVRRGNSLRLARGPAIGVDPFPELDADSGLDARADVRIVAKESDRFFEEDAAKLLRKPLDFAFIDGMHLFEYCLRDFMNIEARSHPNTIVVIDDIFPTHPSQAKRERSTRVWTGDVWKIIPCLREYREDLSILLLDAYPTGLLVLSGLDAKKTVLWDRYNRIVRDFTAKETPPPNAILERRGALPPDSMLAASVLEKARRLRHHQVPAGAGLRSGRAPDSPGLSPSSTLALSVVVVAHNMRRELPRTLLSLSARMQRDVRSEAYEIIVMDNGSMDGLDEAACVSVADNIRYVRISDASPSPVRAMNQGIEMARGDLIGAFVDGARMASPGLLKAALDASLTHPRPVIGAPAFHLGDEVQMLSVPKGYNQEVEDRLLASSGWEGDGYRLFDISCFAGSSAGGWTKLFNETNSLFLRRDMWKELGGYEEAFASPGGGLCNLDVWSRAVELEDACVISLLGEGTFHQTHGGVATNGAGMTREMREEYQSIRGKRYESPRRDFTLYARSHPALADILAKRPRGGP